MDNLTHSLAAVLLARTGLNRLSPIAVPVLLVASNIPDADLVTLFIGGPLGPALTYLEYHRHLTHGLVVAPALGVLSALALFWMKGWKFWPAAAVATIGVWFHILLDLLNNYGVRIWLPFRADWVARDLLMIIDPWMTGFLLLCVLAPLLSRLVSGEIGGKPASGRGWAIAGLLFMALWTGGRFLMHRRAVETLRSRHYQGLVPLRVAAWPTAWSPFLWRGYVSTDDFWALFPIDLNREFDPEGGSIYFKPEGAALLNAARRTPEAQAFLRFAQFPVWRALPLSEPEGGMLLEATDVRFGLPEEGKFQLRIVLDEARRPVTAKFEFGNAISGIGLIRD